ncbi:hypothetical protein LMH73_008690 [Vibrio splendidus]|nr:hypothetical protein [Vibrio splendidus]MCC4879456.1 hypothetical protein [Vibrio splendidus]
MNTNQFTNICDAVKNAGNVNASQVNSGLLMVANDSCGRVIVRKVGNEIERMIYRGTELIESTVRSVWSISELCKATNHYAATTDHDLALLAVTTSSFQFNFCDSDELAECTLHSFRVPKLPELHVNVANRSVAKKILGSSHCFIEEIKAHDTELRYVIEDSSSQSATHKIDSLEHETCYMYDVELLIKYIKRKIPSGEKNHRLGELISEVHQAHILFANTYINSGKCSYVGNGFARHRAFEYDKEDFDEKLNKIHVRAIDAALDTSIELHIVNRVFDEIGFQAGIYFCD